MVQSLSTNGACAVSPDHRASGAALDVMNAGGTAVDAAVAMNAVLGVVRPTDCGIGGDLFALVHRPGDAEPAVLNASGRAGSAVSAAALRADGFDEMPFRHPASITVPGCVDGWAALIERFGSRTLDEALAPAVAIAEEGFEVSPEMAANYAAIAEMVAGQGSAFELFPDGAVPVEGSVVRRPALAKTMRTIGFKGREAFYGGKVAEAIEAASGGLITAVDLGTNRADWVPGTKLDVLGETAWTIPPNSQGYITLATLAIFEQLDAPGDFDDPDYHHLLVESYRAAAWDRGMHLADQDNMTTPIEQLLHPVRLAERADAIGAQVNVWPAATPLPGGTAYMCAMDQRGMAVSLMQSNYAGIGSGISAGDTGVWLQNRGAGFALEDGHPNQLAPRRRPAHTLAPSLWTKDDRVTLLLGTRGGDLQPQLVAQLATDMLYLDMDPTEAQAQPRWALEQFGPGTDSVPSIEETMPAGVIAGLLAKGHHPDIVPAQRAWGPVSIIRVDADGTRHAAADPRVSTAAVAGS